MRALGFQVKKAEVRKMIADIDKDETGCVKEARIVLSGPRALLSAATVGFLRTVDFQEFVDMMTGKMSERDSKEEIQKVGRL